MKLKVAKVAEFISAQNLADNPAPVERTLLPAGSAVLSASGQECPPHTASFPEEIAQGYSIDSRTVGAGEVFFAVKGERFDGHDFVPSALEKGAVAAVVRSDQM